MFCRTSVLVGSSPWKSTRETGQDPFGWFSRGKRFLPPAPIGFCAPGPSRTFVHDVKEGVYILRLESELANAFSKDSVRWESLIKSAGAVSWTDWENRGKKSRSLINVLAKKANLLLSLAETYSKDLNTVARNAVALTSEDRLPIARLVVIKLHNDGHLSGSVNSWIGPFPQPTSLERFLKNYIQGRFSPNQRVFAELLKFGNMPNGEKSSVTNLVLSFRMFPT